MSPFRLRLFLLVPALLLPGLVAAQTTISVDATKPVRTVDERVFGVNAVVWDPQTASAETLALCRSAGVRAIRIPGGGVSDVYHWRTNTMLSETWTWAAGFSAFSQLITSLNAQTFVTVNYGTGTPQEAAAWVAYANASATLLGTGADVAIGVDSNGYDWKTAGSWSALRAASPLATDDGKNLLRLHRSAPFALVYWEVGNECYGTWEQDIQAVAHDPVVYGTRFAQYFNLMKAVDPTIKIGAVAATTTEGPYAHPNHPVTNPATHQTQTNWNPVMLATIKAAGVTPDYLICHRYEQNAGQESDAVLLQLASAPATGWSVDAALLRGALNDYYGTAAANVELCVTENNSVHNNPGKQLTSLVNGLYLADSLGSLLQTEFNAMLWWDLRDGPPLDSNNHLAGNQSASLYGWRQYGDYGILSMPHALTGVTSFYTPYPTYYSLKLLANFARGGDTVVTATSDNTLLSAYAVRRTDGTLRLLVVNKSPSVDRPATIHLSGFTPLSDATVYSYGIPQDEAARTGNGSPDVATSTLTQVAASFTQTFPRYSATVIALAPPSPQIVLQPASLVARTGARVVLTVLARDAAGLAYQWSKDGTPVAGATAADLTLPAVAAADAGSYSVVLTNGQGLSTTSSAATLTVDPAVYVAPTSRLINISTRAQVGTGGNIMIAGVVVGGSGAKRVLIRAVGPALGTVDPSLAPVALADPALEVTTPGGAIHVASNDDWGNDPAIAAAGAAAGAFPLPAGSKDAAVILTLPPGLYTAQVKGVNDTTGVALVEIYDLDTTAAARLINISTRAQVRTGAQAMIAGFAVTGSAPRSLLIRAVGPALAGVDASLAGLILPDPQLDLKTLSGTLLSSNDNWDATNGPAIATTAQTVGAFAFPAGSKDSALLAALNPGLYTPTITDKNGASGLALVEVYEAP